MATVRDVHPELALIICRRRVVGSVVSILGELKGEIKVEIDERVATTYAAMRRRRRGKTWEARWRAVASRTSREVTSD